MTEIVDSLLSFQATSQNCEVAFLMSYPPKKKDTSLAGIENDTQHKKKEHPTQS